MAFILPAAQLAKAFPTTDFTVELICLLDAGLNLTESIQALTSKEEGARRPILDALVAGLRKGQPLSSVLQQFPEYFSPIYCAVVRSSERTGSLRQALAKYVEYDQAFGEVKRKLISVMIYPAVLSVVGTAVILFLMLHVVPRFARLYEDGRGDLPLFSSVLQALARSMEAYGTSILLILGALITGGMLAIREPQTRAWLHQKLWQLPKVGKQMRLFQLARLYRTLGMLLRAGVPVVPAMEMGSPVLSEHLRPKLVSAKRLVQQGLPMSGAFAASGLTTPVASQMMLVGERGGQMGEMLERIAGFCDSELTRWLDRFTRLFEPILMTVIGVGVGLVVVLMYMPIFELAGSLQ